MLGLALQWVRRERGADARTMFRIADQGCGRLRHMRELLPHASELFCVDTEAQLDCEQAIGGRATTVRQAVESASRATGVSCRAMTNEEFSASSLALDIVVCVNVYDVVLPDIRAQIAEDSYRNLASGGHYIVIVPRNDSSILKRCGPHNRYADGHIFPNRGMATFYRNFRDQEEVTAYCQMAGHRLVCDLSRYRQICLIFDR